MMTWLFRVLCLLALYINSSTVAQAQVADWSITHFESRLAVQADGVVAIEEVIQADFGGVAKHGIYRDIPFLYRQNNTEHYTEIKVRGVMRDGKDEPYDESRSDTHLRLKIGAEHATITGNHTYTIAYTVTGVISSLDTYAELYWNTTGNDWEVPIKQVTAYVSLPEPGILQLACYRGDFGSTERCETQKASESDASFIADQPLIAGEGMTIAVGFTKDMVPILAPQKPKEPFELLREELFQPVYWPLAVGGALAGLMVPVWWWWRRGRDWWWQTPAILESRQRAWLKPFGRKPQVVVEFEPPESLRPAQVGVLLDERADTIDITSTIIDLASRGFLTIKEQPKTGIFGSHDYELFLTEKSSQDLLPYENKLLKRLFKHNSTIMLSSLKNTFHGDLEEIKDAVYADLMKRGYFVANPKLIRNRYLGIGFGLLILAAILGVTGYIQVWAWILVLALLPGVAGMSLLVLSVAMPQRTALGFELYRRVLGYQLFISTAEKYRQRFFESQNMFTQILPYAITFGLTAKFAQAMQQIGYQPSQPAWYSGVHAFSLTQFSNDLSSVSKALSSNIASTPSGSGSGGGGSSGGGFGGGGGGSW